MSLRLWHLIRTLSSCTRHCRHSHGLATVTVAPAMRLHVRRVTIPTLPFVEPRKLLQIAVSLTFAVAKLRCAPRAARTAVRSRRQSACRVVQALALALYVGSLAYVVPARHHPQR